jgi:hypothetical protein
MLVGAIQLASLSIAWVTFPGSLFGIPFIPGFHRCVDIWHNRSVASANKTQDLGSEFIKRAQAAGFNCGEKGCWIIVQEGLYSRARWSFAIEERSGRKLLVPACGMSNSYL